MRAEGQCQVQGVNVNLGPTMPVPLGGLWRDVPVYALAGAILIPVLVCALKENVIFSSISLDLPPTPGKPPAALAASELP